MSSGTGATAGAPWQALCPLWWLCTGVVAGALLTLGLTWTGDSAAHRGLLGLGLLAIVAALWSWQHRRRGVLLWLVAGLALAGGRGLQVRTGELDLAQRLAEVEGLALRVSGTISGGWSQARWGWQAPLAVAAARHRQQQMRLPASCRLEVRGQVLAAALPRPGTSIEVLARVKGEPRRPLLVASSATLLQPVGGPSGLPLLRDRLATGLLTAAGTGAGRLRAAELAAALAVGRRDLLPARRRQGWRDAGLAHLLAVSGLHVGLLAGSLWLLLTGCGLRPRSARLLLLLALPAYALLAGAAPSAVRAALMGMTYLAARLLGRALVPLAAVLLAACLLLLAQPQLLLDAGLQLTVLVTAALLRWLPPLLDRLPGPAWLGGLVAVPIVAQAAALPVVGWHFRRLVPGAVLANLAVPVLVTPMLLTSLAAVLLAPLWATGAAWLLDLLSLLERALWWCGGPGRALSLLPAQPSWLLVVLLVIAGWTALRLDRWGRYGALAWLLLLGLWGGSSLWRPVVVPAPVSLLPVADGTAVLVTAGAPPLLVDSGRWQRQAAELLADAGVRELAMAVVSHGDEDHIGGMAELLRCLRVERLVLPCWLLREPAVVPLLRVARQRGTRVVPVARGSVLRSGDRLLEVLWPPLRRPPRDENNRSLVLRLCVPGGTLLLPADIDAATEARLARLSSLGGELLVAGHHGSRSSTSAGLLAAVRPQVVLIPAGPENRHGHPHAEVLQRLRRAGIPFRYPAEHGWCGARPAAGGWRPVP